MADRRVCSIAECGNIHYAREYCNKHYLRWRLNGHPLSVREYRIEWMLRHKDYALDNCLIWPYSFGTNGRPTIEKLGKAKNAARVMCELVKGPPPIPKYHAAHSCGNTKCLNPKHIYWKTAKENERDKIVHGTRYKKLNSSQVRIIRSLRGKMMRKDVAARFKVTPPTIGAIWSNDTWSWLK
jgi:hypothetical protein